MNAFLYAVMILLLLLAFRYARRIQRDRRHASQAAALRMLRYTEQGRPYVYYIGEVLSRVRFSSRAITGTEANPIGRWLRVTDFTRDGAVTETGQTIPLDAIDSYLVTYPNGQVLDGYGLFEPLPEEAFILDGDSDIEYGSIHLDPEDIGRDSGLVHLAIANVTQPDDPEATYRITLTNMTQEPLTLVRAALFEPTEMGALSPVDVYERHVEAVLDWFGMNGTALGPGESVIDPNGHGEPGEVWAFYFAFPDGTEIVAAERLPGRTATAVTR